ncbi:hypothetical protein KSC_050670 [Ktedonobacter sp. SOSP1-52]|nr:hypothetical protein KSC_050670 [Ktedonobacter sp. SOSP1-52]
MSFCGPGESMPAWTLQKLPILAVKILKRGLPVHASLKMRVRRLGERLFEITQDIRDVLNAYREAQEGIVQAAGLADLPGD